MCLCSGLLQWQPSMWLKFINSSISVIYFALPWQKLDDWLCDCVCVLSAHHDDTFCPRTESSWPAEPDKNCCVFYCTFGTHTHTRRHCNIHTNMHAGHLLQSAPYPCKQTQTQIAHQECMHSTHTCTTHTYFPLSTHTHRARNWLMKVILQLCTTWGYSTGLMSLKPILCHISETV